MSVFERYSRYYDLLNAGKDYGAEVDYVARQLRAANPGVRSILELGSGTARHARLFAAAGFDVCCVEMSDSMLASARAALEQAPAAIRGRIELHQGDARSVRLPRRCDAVVSLFHVVSYQTRNEDLAAMFATARHHLAPGGLFFFDYWHGPGVLTDLPTARVKDAGDETLAVTRRARPEMLPRQNMVKVHYEITGRDLASGETERIDETHPMRYLFEPELDVLLSAAGFRVLRTLAWLGDEPPGLGSWNACTLAEAT
jgi:SAM-dependent methyltransferase